MARRSDEQRAKEAAARQAKWSLLRAQGLPIHPRTPEQRRIENAQTRARRARARLAKLPILPATDCHYYGTIKFGSAPTRTELLVVGEILTHGGLSEAADCLGAAHSTIKNRMCTLYKRLGAVSFPHMLGLLGWVDVPSRYRRVHRTQPALRP